jgi:uncharacterized protein (DUF952 family)
MPRLVEKPTTVVKTKDVCIDEFFGGASCNPCGDISFAHVKAQAGWAEEWQAPAFDEYTLILKGSITVESTHSPPLVVKAGQAVFMPKGERVRWVFKEAAEYVPICLPAFSPDNCFREEGPKAAPPPHDKYKDVYHLVQTKLWLECKASGKTYYPPTYEQDGFTHATSDPAKLLTVANYFYKDVSADWICLKMTRDSLAKAKMTLKFEDPSPVGSKKPLTAKESAGERFPHIYGGIPSSGVVVEEFVVQRGIDGLYLSIDGLVAPSVDASSTPVMLAKLLASKIFALVPSSSAVACGVAGVALGVALSKRK